MMILSKLLKLFRPSNARPLRNRLLFSVLLYCRCSRQTVVTAKDESLHHGFAIAFQQFLMCSQSCHQSETGDVHQKDWDKFLLFVFRPVESKELAGLLSVSGHGRHQAVGPTGSLSIPWTTRSIHRLSPEGKFLQQKTIQVYGKEISGRKGT